MAKFTSTELKATRLGFGEALVELGHEHPNVVVLGADVTGSVRTDLFMKAFPDRFFSVGIAEQDMIGTAAGLAVAGKIPFASTYGEFAVGRPFDQIRQSLEDIAIMRVLPHMTVATPCDYHQAKRMVKSTMAWNHPIYIRFFRDNTPVFTDPSAPFALGKADTLIDGTDATIIACGLQVWEAILAEETLAAAGIRVRVINMHTIKPLDHEAVIKAAKETGAIVTAEDHQRHGGLGGAVAETLAEFHPTPQEFVAVNDTFGESGMGPELMMKYQIAKDDIVKAVKTVLKRKRS